MSSSYLLSRCRSHSASSPAPRRQTDDGKWRASAKRSRPSSLRSPSYKDIPDQPAEKWDVEQWRRGKRARRDSSTEESSDELSGLVHATALSDPIMPSDQIPTFGLPSTSRLPSTSAAFQFFPQKPRRKPLPRSRRIRLHQEASPRESDYMSSEDARRMRTDALGALHRSVAENSEGLVRRMRDWERSRFMSPRSIRSIPPSPYAEGVSRHSSQHSTLFCGIPQATPVAEHSEDEDEDDVFIVGDTSLDPISRSPSHKKRALSLSMMDVEVEGPPSSFARLGVSDYGFSPTDRSSGASAYSSDDDGHADMDTEISSDLFFTPALSHTYSVSTNSSLVSLPLSAPANESNTLFMSSMLTPSVTPGTNSPSTFLPSTASRSEKAIAALTLAMANGAAGISDYDVSRMTEELTTLDASHAATPISPQPHILQIAISMTSQRLYTFTIAVCLDNNLLSHGLE